MYVCIHWQRLSWEGGFQQFVDEGILTSHTMKIDLPHKLPRNVQSLQKTAQRLHPWVVDFGRQEKFCIKMFISDSVDLHANFANSVHVTITIIILQYICMNFGPQKSAPKCFSGHLKTISWSFVQQCLGFTDVHCAQKQHPSIFHLFCVYNNCCKCRQAIVDSTIEMCILASYIIMTLYRVAPKK